MWENAYLSIKNPKASRARLRALDPGCKLLTLLARLRFATLATFSLRTWAPPLLTKSWIRTWLAWVLALVVMWLDSNSGRSLLCKGIIHGRTHSWMHHLNIQTFAKPDMLNFNYTWFCFRNFLENGRFAESWIHALLRCVVQVHVNCLHTTYTRPCIIPIWNVRFLLLFERLLVHIITHKKS